MTPYANKALDAAIKGFIAELREPTPEMIDAAATAADKVGSGDFVAIWQAMIDAALK